MRLDQRQHRIATALAFCLGLALTSGLFGFSTAAIGVGELPVLRVGHVGHDHQIALGVAALKGQAFQADCGVWFQELKPREVYILHERETPLAELHLIKVQGGSAMPAAMERGELDIGLGGVPAVAFFVDRGNDFKILAPLNTDGDMLVMRKNFEAAHWQDFVRLVKQAEKPLIIGYKAPVAVAKLVFERGLMAEGIAFGAPQEQTDTKIRLTNLQGQKNMIPSLASGAVDGFVTNEPAASRAEVIGCGRVVCDLADLPPEGKWRNHPCCCVAARAEAITQHSNILVALLKAIVAATEQINNDKVQAAELASQWTKTPLEVESRSVPHIRYLATPSPEWRRGMTVWIEMMQEMDTFQERFADLEADKVMDRLCDFTLISRAQNELKAERESKEKDKPALE